MARLFRRAPRRCNQRISSAGFTIIEILVAMALTLLIMGTVVNVFANLGTSVSDSRSGIEMFDQVQGVRDRLQRDLEGVTVTTKPWQRLESGGGYFEIIEGPRSDLVTKTAPESATVNTTNATQLTLPATSRVPQTALGDFDDLMMFTSSNPAEPFVGRGCRTNPSTGVAEDTMVEANEAEIFWFAIEHSNVAPASTNYPGEPGMRSIYRRALLIAPGMQFSSYANSLTTLRQFYEEFDVSVRRVGSVWVANSLADLTWRENRIGHSGTFPCLVDVSRIDPPYTNVSGNSPIGPLTLDLYRGQDLMLRNALAFDIRVYDPRAPLKLSSGVVVGPGDPGWSSGGTNPSDTLAVGAFVDLNYMDTVASSAISWFSSRSQNVSGNGARLFNAQWDTWPFVYEQDGQDQDGDSLVDEGTNGFDNNSDNVIDDPAEYETAPPYLAPLRGISVRVRAYEPSSRQIREISVVENFSGK